MRMFKRTEWSGRPPEHAIDGAGRHLVARNVNAVARDGAVAWVGELAIMDDAAYGAYLGSQEAERKREQEIVDETVLGLIEEGSL